MKNLLIFILIICSNVQFSAQETLTFEKFKQLVLENHPVMQQVKNAQIIGNREIQKAKGSLDPSFSSDMSKKQFDEKEYYFLSNSGLKVPTWYGIDFKAGYEANRGVNINDENYVPSSGLWYAGVEIPLGEGLFMDERRSAILQAKIFQQQNNNEQQLIVNDLLLDALQSYWNWYEANQKVMIALESLRFAEERFVGVKENAILGDIPIIDTVEAQIQLDNRRFDLIQAQTNFLNAGHILNTYLWSSELIPLELKEETKPGEYDVLLDLNEKILLRFNDSIQFSAPQVMATNYKLQQLEIEERLKREMLKPQVNLRYNFLSQPVGNNPIQNFSPENYKFGIQIYTPLFLRKERAGLAQVKLKIENTELELKRKMIEFQNKEKILRNEIFQYNDQLTIQNQQVINSKKLRDSEQIRFEAGESSLFLVNSREVSYLSSKVKQIELQAKLKISEAKFKWLYSELFNF